MNKKVKKLWVDTLRSNKYKQGKGVLRDKNNKFCCLGVLCDLHRKEVGGAKWVGSEWEWEYLDASELLPNEVVEWADLPDCDPNITDHGSLVGANDTGSTFPEIADIIEKEL